MNKRFGLYEPPAITVSRGVYSPKTGMLGRLGFSSLEAALIRKDLKAFTRRRELMSIFIFPIIMIIIPFFQTFGSTGSSGAPDIFQISTYMAAYTFIFPASIMAISLGNFMIGEEGQGVWRIFASPISAHTLVKSKFFFIVIFALIVLAITGTIGVVIYQPTFKVIIIGLFEGIFLVFTLGTISLSNGISGADFTETPRPRMIRQKTAILNFIACGLAGLGVLAPFIPYVISTTLSTFMPSFGTLPYLEPYMATALSAVIATVIAVIFYRIAIDNAKELLSKGQI